MTSFGPNTKTVGNGGDFTTFDEAMDWVIRTYTQGWTQLAQDLTTVITATGSDVIEVDGQSTASLLVEPFDYVQVLPFRGKPSFYMPIMAPPKDATELIAFHGAPRSADGPRWTIWRPKRVVLLLLAGEHRLTSDKLLPEGLWLEIVGIGSSAILLSADAANPASIVYQARNIISMNNLTLAYKPTASYLKPGASVDAENHDALFRFTKLNYYGAPEFGAPPFVCRGASIRLYNIRSENWFFDANTFLADDIIVDGFLSHTTLPTASSEYLLALGMNNIEQDVSKPFLCKNVFIECNADTALRLEFTGNSVDKKVRFIHSVIRNTNAGSNSLVNTISIPAGAKLDGYCSALVVDGQIEVASVAGIIRVLDSQVQFSSVTPALLTISQRKPIAFTRDLPAVRKGPVQEVDPPDANLSNAWNVTPVMERQYNVPMPTNSASSQTLALKFTQDSNGGNLISFDTEAFSIPASITLHGTANQMAVFEFIYNGNIWVLANSPEWFE